MRNEKNRVCLCTLKGEPPKVLTKLKQFCQTSVLGQGLGVDFTFAWYNNNNNNNNKDNNPHLNSLKGSVLGDKEQGVGIRVKG